MGEALQSLIRPYDYAARWAGDEFVLLLADTEDGDASVTARVAAMSSANPGVWATFPLASVSPATLLMEIGGGTAGRCRRTHVPIQARESAQSEILSHIPNQKR